MGILCIIMEFIQSMTLYVIPIYGSMHTLQSSKQVVEK